MLKIAVTVPTRGDHPDLLERLVAACGVEREAFIVVRTAPIDPPLGASSLDDFGPINIHRWWNAGLDAAQQLGADYCAVINDDIAVGEGTIEALAGAAHRSGAAIAAPGTRYRLMRDRYPVRPALLGSLWVLDLRCRLRPDEGFRWWFGDNDLDIRARRDFGGLVTVPVSYQHLHASESTDTSPTLQALARQDEETFKDKHPLAHYWRVLDTRLGGRLRRRM